MLNPKALSLFFACALAFAAPPAPAPPLEPGEALALAGPDGIAHLFGDTQSESPMGELATLVWLKLEGAEWNAANVVFKCTGTFNGVVCSAPKGHGTVTLAQAVQTGCDLAILTWANMSALGWKKDYGDGAGRARLEDAFSPFLGRRMPRGEDLPFIDNSWIGAGSFLRVSPEGMLVWLSDPAQDEVLRRTRRLLLSFMKEIRPNTWWIFTGTADVPGEPGGSAWAVGGDGNIMAVLRLPKGMGRAQAMARFRTIMLVPAK